MENEINTKAVEAMGYEVKVRRTDSGKVGYELFGPSGAHYGLTRSPIKPQVMIATNLRRLGVVKIRGYIRFTDQGGILRPLN